MSNLSTITNWMLAQVGTSENPKGSNNIQYNTDYYGRPVMGDAYPWCVSFPWDGFRINGLSKLFLGGQKTASVAYVMQWAKNHGQWVTSGYREGDLLCYGTEHIGYCISANGNTITTIEGNYSDRVAKVNRNISEVTGAYRPNYGVEDVPAVPENSETAPAPEPETPLPPAPDYDFSAGDIVRIVSGATYWNGSRVPSWVLAQNWVIHSVYGERAVINKNENGTKRIMSAISTRYLQLVKTAAEAAVEVASVTEYTVRAGDTLWGIAQKFLGNGVKYKLIQAENGLKNANIYPGQVLKIPKEK